jgi:hypothetical protein
MSGRDSGKMQALNAKLGLGCRISVVDLDDPASVDKRCANRNTDQLHRTL